MSRPTTATPTGVMLPRGIPVVADVPTGWQARGFSGRYVAEAIVPAALARTLAEHAPCLLRDQAWLLLAVDDDPAGDPGDGTPDLRRIVLVRLDAAALVDMTARRPPPGCYRPPEA